MPKQKKTGGAKKKGAAAVRHTNPDTKRSSRGRSSISSGHPSSELAAAALSILLQQPAVTSDNRVLCKLLSASKGVTASAHLLLAGCVSIERVEDLSRYSIHHRQEEDWCPQCTFADAAAIAPWLAKHGRLLRALTLDIKRTTAPITEEFAAARAPPGRACCACCGGCGFHDWGETCCSKPTAGMAVCPTSEALLAAALRTASESAAGGLLLQEFKCTPASNALLQLAPAASLTRLRLTFFDDDETTTDITATAAALAQLTALKDAAFNVRPSCSEGFHPFELDSLVPAALSGLTRLTSLVLDRVLRPSSLAGLPVSLVQLRLRLITPPRGRLHLGRLTALQSCDLGLARLGYDGIRFYLANEAGYRRLDPHAPVFETGPILTDADVLPSSLTQLALHGGCPLLHERPAARLTSLVPAALLFRLTGLQALRLSAVPDTQQQVAEALRPLASLESFEVTSPPADPLSHAWPSQSIHDGWRCMSLLLAEALARLPALQDLLLPDMHIPRDQERRLDGCQALTELLCCSLSSADSSSSEDESSDE